MHRPGANVNAVTDDALSDAPSGASMLFGGPVEVEALSDASSLTRPGLSS
jgi:hypothetical protein